MREHILSLVSRHLTGPFKPSGSNIMCRCPFHKDGQEASPSFGVDLEKGVFNCFACHIFGDLRKLLTLLNIPKSTIDSDLSSIAPELERAKELHKNQLTHFFAAEDPFRAKHPIPEVILGIYDWMPMGLVEKGFNPSILQSMEIGFDRTNNRITYPLRDMYGTLAGISGGATQPNQYPKYKIYQGGKTERGMWQKGDFGDWFDKEHPGFKCENHNYLWNYHRVFHNVVEVGSSVDLPVYVVEGFKACLWMIQAGFVNTVAIMGSYLSEHQQRLLHRFGGSIVLCLDNDEAGIKATTQIGKALWRPMYGRLKALQYPDPNKKAQPDDFSVDMLQKMVTMAPQFVHKPMPLRRQ